jgi:hypothetical protein
LKTRDHEQGSDNKAATHDLVEAFEQTSGSAGAAEEATDHTIARRRELMNAGERAIDWLYKSQLQIDEEWSVRTEPGFRWWPDQHAQTIELTGEVEGPDGATGSCIGVRTEVLRDLDLTDSAAVFINEVIKGGMCSMSGLVYDADTRRLDLCSLVAVHDDTLEWMQRLISIAAVLQIAEATGMAATFVKYSGAPASEATSGHPTNGMRTTPDEMAGIARSVVVPHGQQPCTWVGDEFEDVVQQYMQRAPSLLATGDQTGFTVEFPYGDSSCLCQATTDRPHPAYGNGLRVTQSFPVSRSSDADGARFALLMNAAELAGKPLGYGFGSYFYEEGLLCFSTFFPNFIHKPGLLPNLYFASAQRARAMSMRFTGKDWTGDSFDIRNSAAGGMFFGPPPAVQPKKTRRR